MVFSPINSLSKQKRVMCRCMKNPCNLKVRRYAVRLIDLNEYLSSFTGVTMGVTELNEILLNSMPNSWSKQAYLRAFNSETISFDKAVNLLELM